MNTKVRDELVERFKDIQGSTETPAILATVEVLKAALDLCATANSHPALLNQGGPRLLCIAVPKDHITRLEMSMNILWEIIRDPLDPDVPIRHGSSTHDDPDPQAK